MASIRKYKNQYYLLNNTLTTSTYTVSLANNCCNCQTLPEPTILNITAGQEVLLPLNVDGEYNVYIPASSTEPTFTIQNYNSLESRLIQDAKSFLCGDECIGCQSKNKEFYLLQYQNIFNEILVFHNLYTYSEDNTSCENCRANSFIQAAFRLYNCDILNDMCNLFVQTDYYNSNKGNIDLLQKLIGIYYLSFYFRAYDNAVNTEEQQFIDDLYDICDIKRCIRKLGISFEDLQELYENIVSENCGCEECNENPINLAPTSAANFSIPVTDTTNHVIPGNLFLNGYVDPEGDMLHSILITGIDRDGSAPLSIFNNGVPLQVGDVISTYSLFSGALSYTLPIQPNTISENSIKYKPVDTGSLSPGPIGVITLNFVK